MKLQQLNEYEIYEALTNIPVNWDEYLLNEAWDDIKLSHGGKLPPNIPAWSLNAGITCPAAKCPTTGDIKPSCRSCYAKRGHFAYDNVKDPRNHNQKDWKRLEKIWVG